MTKTADKKTQTKKTSNCSTVQMKRLHALLNLPIKTVPKSFHHLKKCKHHERMSFQTKKRPANESSEDGDDDHEEESKTVRY
jgi:hypothetical protein